jgi:hypothetical protein
MKTQHIGMIALIAAVSVFALVGWSDGQQGSSPTRLITVTGDAEVRVVPDEVILTLGVETWNKDVDVAKRQNDKRVQQVLDLAKEYGIESKHIQTEHISIEPRYEENWEKRGFIGFFVRKTVVITLKDVSKFEGLLTSVLGSGANYVHGIQFRTTELRKHKDQARALAVRAAQEKAEAMAGELGEQIGKPQSIREDQIGWWSGYGGWWGARWGGMMAQNVVQNIGAGPMESDGSLAPGQISINARVTTTFELR